MTTLFITGCTPGKQHNAQIDMEGLYFWGDGFSIFQPCDQHQVYWLDGNESSLRVLTDHYHEDKVAVVHKPVYTKVRVTNIGYQFENGASNFDETLYIIEILDVADFNQKTCILPEIRDY